MHRDGTAVFAYGEPPCFYSRSQSLKLKRQYVVIPTCLFSQAIVRKNIGALLLITEMRETNRGNGLHVQQLCRLNATVPGYHQPMRILHRGEHPSFPLRLQPSSHDQPPDQSLSTRLPIRRASA